MLPATFAASFAPISSDFQLNVWNVLTLVGALVALWAAVRRKPTVDVDLVQLKSSIDGLQKSVDALTANQKEHAANAVEIDQLKAEVRELKSHRENDGGTQRRHIAHLSREIFDKIDALDNKFSANLQSIERGLGRFDGAFDLIRDRLNGGRL